MSVLRGSYLRHDETCFVGAHCRQKLSRPGVAPAPADRANSVSELIPVKPDGIINGCRVTGAACLQFDLFARAYLVVSLYVCMCVLLLFRNADAKWTRRSQMAHKMASRLRNSVNCRSQFILCEVRFRLGFQPS